MTTYVARGRRLDPEAPEAADALRRLHAAGERLLCACAEPPPPMYLSRFGDLILVKRMPETGHLHAAGCPHYEPPAELSGLAEVLGSAIVEGPGDAPTNLRLAFSLTRSAGRTAPSAEGAGDGSVSTEGRRLSLRATLHHLWHEAGLDRWSPAAPRRSWGEVRGRVLTAAAASTAKGAPLAARLFMPEPFHQDRRAEIDGRRAATLAPLSVQAPGRPRPLMLVIGEVKEVLPARYGHRLVLRHLGPFPLLLAEDLHRRLKARYAGELEIWSATEGARLLVIGTFGMSAAGVASLEEAALVLANEHWLPFETVAERELLAALHAAGRPFLRGLRYNLAPDRPLATAILPDVTPTPAALYVMPAAPSADYLAALADITAHGTSLPWFWQTAAEAMPPLPPRRGYQPMPVPTPPHVPAPADAAAGE